MSKVSWVQRGGPAKALMDYWSRFLTRKWDSETESTEQGEVIPGKRDGECILYKKKYSQRPGRSDREE